MPVEAISGVEIPQFIVEKLAAEKALLTAQDTMVVALPTVEKAYVPSKPQISPVLFAINNVIELTRLGKMMMAWNSARLTDKYKEMDELRIKMAQQIQENVNKSGWAKFWDILQDIGTCVLAAISAVIGISLVSTGAGSLIGGAMIASGVLSIALLIGRKTGAVDWLAKEIAGDDEQLRKLLTMLIPGAVGVACGLLSLGGMIGAWSSINIVQQALSIAQAAASISGGVLTLGRGIVHADVKWGEAQMVELRKALTVLGIDIEKIMKGMERFMEHMALTNKQGQRALKTYEDMKHHAILHNV